MTSTFLSLFDCNSIPENVHHFLALCTGVWQHTPFKLQPCQTGENISCQKKGTKVKYPEINSPLFLSLIYFRL